MSTNGEELGACSLIQSGRGKALGNPEEEGVSVIIDTDTTTENQRGSEIKTSIGELVCESAEGR